MAAITLQFEFKMLVWKANGSTTPAVEYTDQKTFHVANPFTNWSSEQHDFDQIDMSNFNSTDYRPSALMRCRISRIGGDGADTLSNAIFLLGFDLHYSVSQLGGSVSSYP
jgi:hypothetical protein